MVTVNEAERLEGLWVVGIDRAAVLLAELRRLLARDPHIKTRLDSLTLAGVDDYIQRTRQAIADLPELQRLEKQR